MEKILIVGNNLNSKALINTIQYYEDIYDYKIMFISINENSNYKIMKELKDDCKKYQHLHIITDYYDEENKPELNNWTDVEGEGYGWLWLRVPEDKIGLRLKKDVHEHIKYKKKMIKKLGLHEPIIRIETKDSIIYHLIERESMQRDTRFEFSDKELDW